MIQPLYITLILILTGGLIISILRILKYRGTISTVEKLLDQLLKRDPDISINQYSDNLGSKLAHRTGRIIELIHKERADAQGEKEQLQSLLADISHQVKTPLANIALYNSLALEEAGGMESPESKALSEYLNRSSEQTDKLTWLMEQLVKTARLETGIIAPQPVMADLKATLATVLDDYWEPAEEKKIAIKVEPFEGKDLLHDPRWTAEAIGNILDNAIKYSPEDSTITISFRELEFFCELSLKDEGPGISPDSYNDVFKRFFRAGETSDKPGVGLGLYIAQIIMNLQGGYIAVKKNLKSENGADFTVFIRKNVELS